MTVKDNIDKVEKIDATIIETEIVVSEPKELVSEPMGFTQMMEMAEMLSKSTIVPVEYRNRPENTFIALDLSNRLGLSPMAVMSGLHIINGKPSFSGSFIAGLIKSTSLFSDVEIVWVGEELKESWGCYVTAIETRTNKRVKGATITLKMAKLEGWLKNVKWQSMTEQMLMYRAFSFFGRTHASELLSGIYDKDELDDLRQHKIQKVVSPYGELED